MISANLDRWSHLRNTQKENNMQKEKSIFHPITFLTIGRLDILAHVSNAVK